MIAENINTINSKIRACEKKCNKIIGSTKLVAVSKRKNANLILEAHNCGQVFFGENYLQEAIKKVSELPSSIKWHFIGNLQSNKVKKAVASFDVIETVDKLRLAQAIDKQVCSLNKNVSFLIQVNIGDEIQKSGIAPEKAEGLLKEIIETTSLKASGIMVIPPYSPQPEASRPFFIRAKKLTDELAKKELFFNNESVELSMGMSSDYIQAIEEGATIVRVGTAIFGKRD